MWFDRLDGRFWMSVMVYEPVRDDLVEDLPGNNRYSDIYT